MITRDSTIGEIIAKRVNIIIGDYNNMCTHDLYKILDYNTLDKTMKDIESFSSYIRTAYDVYARCSYILLSKNARIHLDNNVSISSIVNTIIEEIRGSKSIVLSNKFSGIELMFLEEIIDLLYGDRTRFSASHRVILDYKLNQSKVTSNIRFDNTKTKYPYNLKLGDELQLLMGKLSHNDFINFMNILIGLTMSVGYKLYYDFEHNWLTTLRVNENKN